MLAWLERLEDSTTGSLNDATANRVELTNQAIDMIADYPLVGVGPWRYTIVAEAMNKRPNDLASTAAR